MNKKELVTKIKDLFIVRENDGTYNLFGKYLIKQNQHGTYSVNVLDNDDRITLEFSSLRNAVTWCVFEKNRKYKEIKRIHELDDFLSSIDAMIAQHRRLIERNKNSEDKHIFMAKLFEERLKKRKAIEEMNEYASLSKHWQTKKFAENQGV